MTAPAKTSTRETRDAARTALRTALDAAANVLGEDAATVCAAQHLGLSAVDDGPEPFDRDALDEIGRLAHEGHDPFRPEHCQREVCRRIAELAGHR